MPLAILSPADSRATIDAGAHLVDICHADERAHERINGELDLPWGGCEVIVRRRSGIRTAANAARLAEAAGGAPTYILRRRIDAWRTARRATVTDRKQPLEIKRKVQIISAAGRTFARVIAWCEMANLLRIVHWNRRVAA